jgi:hypothetical protein
MQGKLESSMQDFDRLGQLLNDKSAQGDVDIPVLLLKGVAGGQGSGLRINKAEIERTAGGATKWEQLQQQLNRWSTTKQAPILDDAQRNAIRRLATLFRQTAYDKHTKIAQTRRKINDATDLKTINNAPVDLGEELFPQDSPLTTDPSAPEKMSVDDIKKQIRGR